VEQKLLTFVPGYMLRYESYASWRWSSH